MSESPAMLRFVFGWGPSRLEAEANVAESPATVRFSCFWHGLRGGTFDCGEADLRKLIDDGLPYVDGQHRLEQRNGRFYYRVQSGSERIELDRSGLDRLLGAIVEV